MSTVDALRYALTLLRSEPLPAPTAKTLPDWNATMAAVWLIQTAYRADLFDRIPLFGLIGFVCGFVINYATIESSAEHIPLFIQMRVIVTWILLLGGFGTALLCKMAWLELEEQDPTVCWILTGKTVYISAFGKVTLSPNENANCREGSFRCPGFKEPMKHPEWVDESG